MPLVLINTDHAKASAPFPIYIDTEAETQRNGLRLCHDAERAAPVDMPEKRRKRSAGARHLERGILTLASGIIMLVLVIGHAMKQLIRIVRDPAGRQRRHQSSAINTTIHRGHGNANLYLCKS
ncbi:MAG: hypothetical protein JXA07_01255 [Spirochaetes bacterium]|nr:hypothetical protein [Spirochaetota bacterium]